MGEFPQRLRAARTKQGWSQNDLAVASGIEKPRLSRYENGWVEPRLSTVEVIADALGVNPAALVGWSK